MDFIEALNIMKKGRRTCVKFGNPHESIIRFKEDKLWLEEWSEEDNMWKDVDDDVYTWTFLASFQFKTVPDPSVRPMTFMEAVRECENGKDIRRKAWLRDLRIKSSNRDKLIIQSETLSFRTVSLDWSDIIANDWEVGE